MHFPKPNSGSTIKCPLITVAIDDTVVTFQGVQYLVSTTIFNLDFFYLKMIEWRKTTFNFPMSSEMAGTPALMVLTVD